MPVNPANPPSSLDRLERALSVYCEWQEAGQPGTAQEFLGRHPELREVLEPMVLGEDAADAAPAPASGERLLGEYRLVREVGRGGMGVVWEAEQVALDRRVAVKVLRAQVTAEPRRIARFKREAAMAARLRHPGIVEVYGVGEQDEVFWYAMELVDGEPLGAVDGTTGKLRPLAQRVELVAEVAEALGHAHTQGVVHRDVKPGNILVRRDGRAVLTDFGLAHDEALPTITIEGSFQGTPHYVSPEQANGLRVDARSDVFSLGVTLYELLTRVRPFDAPTTAEVLERVRHEDPLDPARVDPHVPADLAAVVLKALEKDPAARYPDGGAMAADLRAFLAGQPVSARRRGRVALFLRRVRREPVKAALVGVLTLSVPTIAALLGYQVANAPLVQAGRDRLRAERIEALKTEAFLAFGDEDLDRAVAAFEEVLGLDPDDLEAATGLCVVLAESGRAAQALPRVEAALVRWPAAEAAQRARAHVLERLGRRDEARTLIAGAGTPKGASAAFLAGLREWVRGKEVDDRQAYARAARHFAQAVQWSATARAVYHFYWARAASETQDKTATADAVAAIEELWLGQAGARYSLAYAILEQDPRRAIQLYEEALRSGVRVAASWQGIGLARERLGDPDGAMAAYGEALRASPGMAAAHVNRSRILLQRQDLDGAIAAARAALDADPRRFRAWNNLGIALRRKKDLSGAEEAYRKALEIRPDYAIAWFNLGNVQKEAQRRAAAVESFQRAVAEDPAYGRAWNNLGDTLSELGRWQEANEVFGRAHALMPKDVIPLANLGRCLEELRDYPGAEARYRAALELQPKLAFAWQGLVRVLKAQGRNDEAERSERTAREAAAGAATRPQTRGAEPRR
ncbi:MAG: tetratricopeptide repeat protein [Planctomycetes bacterium]|nr:tetratricopeptide repeat protein [Planctomycetota bacterium]